MRLLFKKTCACPINPQTLPKPSFKITSSFDTDDEEPSIHATVELVMCDL